MKSVCVQHPRRILIVDPPLHPAEFKGEAQGASVDFRGEIRMQNVLSARGQIVTDPRGLDHIDVGVYVLQVAIEFNQPDCLTSGQRSRLLACQFRMVKCDKRRNLDRRDPDH